MDPTEELIKKLQQQIEEVRRGSVGDKRRAREARLENERREQEARRRRQQYEYLLSETTLDEYLTILHDTLFLTLTVETNPRRCSPRAISEDVTGKLYPQHVRPWVSFDEEMGREFSRLETTLGQNKLFSSRAALADKDRPPKIRSGKGLGMFQ